MQNLGTLTIFGAGLIGGSVALCAKRAGLVSQVIAVDRKPEPSDRAHPFDVWIEHADLAATDRAFASSSLILLCTPVRSIIAELPRALRSGAVVADCGSTKAAVSSSAQKCPGSERFVPSHPMAGHPVGGLGHATADLFQDRRWLICPEGAGAPALALVRDFVTALGATPIELSAAEHDRSVAITSHLPQLIASALAALAHGERALLAAGPGFASATRVAGGAESIWRDIFETNGSEVGKALRLLAGELERTGQALEAGEVDQALGLLEQARRAREAE